MSIKTTATAKERIGVAIAAVVICLLVGGIAASLYQSYQASDRDTLVDKLNAEHDKDPQIQRLRKKAGIKD